MTPYQLRRELEAAGLIILDVTRHVRDDNVAVVYLHGAAGQWVNGYAVSVAAAVPGVKSAIASLRTPAIILVLLESGNDSYQSAPLT